MQSYIHQEFWAIFEQCIKVLNYKLDIGGLHDGYVRGEKH